jgi:hypothetical protein
VRNILSLVLGILHVLLAVAVIVLASIPARSVPATPVIDNPPPVAGI